MRILSLIVKSTRILVVCSIVLCPLFGQEESESQAEHLFRFPVAGVITSGPTVSGSRVWLISDAKTLYVLTTDGTAIGKRTLPYRKAEFLVCDAFGRAAVSDGAGGIALINKAGQEVWRVTLSELGEALSYPPIFSSDGRLYLVCGATLYALAPNGTKLWQTNLPAKPSCGMAVAQGGGPAIGMADGSLAVYSPDGELLAMARLSAAPAALAASAAYTAVALPQSKLVFIRSSDEIRIVDTGSAAPLVSVSAAPDSVYALTAGGELMCYDMQGLRVWRQQLAPNPKALRVEARGAKIIVFSMYDVWSYGADGVFYKRLKLSNASCQPAMDSRGFVFSGGADWILYAYRFERLSGAADSPKVPSISAGDIEAAAREEALWAIPSGGDDAAMKRLTAIEKTLKSGTIDISKRGDFLYASALALNKLEKPSATMTRAFACYILGEMALPIAVPTLTQVFKDDADDAVRAAAVRAVGRIGLDPENTAMKIFADALAKPVGSRTALALIEAIDALYRAGGTLHDSSGILALVRISGGNYPYDVREKARKAITRITSSK